MGKLNDKKTRNPLKFEALKTLEIRMDRIKKGIEGLHLGIVEQRESQKKTDEQQRKTEEQLRGTIQRLDEMGRQLGDLGLVQGEVAEDLFFRNVCILSKPKEFA